MVSGTLLVAGAVLVVFSFDTSPFLGTWSLRPWPSWTVFSSYLLYIVPWVPYILRRGGCKERRRCRIDVAESGVNIV